MNNYNFCCCFACFAFPEIIFPFYAMLLIGKSGETEAS